MGTRTQEAAAGPRLRVRNSQGDDDLSKRIHVLTHHEELAATGSDGVVVVIDVLFATSTLITAVDNGAREVLIAETEQEARILSRNVKGPVILGGEKQGKRLPDFDLGPVPLDYGRDVLFGKAVIYVSTNGTPAMIKAGRTGLPVLLASLRNAPATARYLGTASDDRDIYLLCSGSRGLLSLEDFVCAGHIAAHLRAWDPEFYNDAALAAMQVAESRPCLNWVSSGQVGRALVSHGLEHVVSFCSEIGTTDTVVALDGRRLVPMGNRER